jgi:hypothetical protein
MPSAYNISSLRLLLRLNSQPIADAGGPAQGGLHIVGHDAAGGGQGTAVDPATLRLRQVRHNENE